MFTPESTSLNSVHLALAPLIAGINQVVVQHRGILHKLDRGNFHYCSTASCDAGGPIPVPACLALTQALAQDRIGVSCSLSLGSTCSNYWRRAVGYQGMG